jgi:hypothetical protein
MYYKLTSAQKPIRRRGESSDKLLKKTSSQVKIRTTGLQVNDTHFVRICINDWPIFVFERTTRTFQPKVQLESLHSLELLSNFFCVKYFIITTKSIFYAF